MTAGWAETSMLSYGGHPAQVVEIGSDTGTHLVLVLLHGGYWRAKFGRELMWPLARNLCGRGLTVANVEYRRGSGWSHTVADVGDALDALRDYFPGRRLVLVGHSAGGHLALLHASAADAVLALAPVTDLTRGYLENIGEGAVSEFIGTSPLTDPDLYLRLSPSPRSIGLRTMFVHGPSDDRVPVAHTDAFVRAICEEHPAPRYLRPADVGHLDLIDPAAQFWFEALAWMHDQTGEMGETHGDRPTDSSR